LKEESIQGRRSIENPEEQEHWVLTRRGGGAGGQAPSGPCDPCGRAVLFSHVTLFAFSVIATLPTLTRTATSETESKSRDLSICAHHYTLRAPCPKGQRNDYTSAFIIAQRTLCTVGTLRLRPLSLILLIPQFCPDRHRRENVSRTENALGTWPAELKVDLKRSQTGSQHDICMCFVAYWTPLFHSVRPNG